VEHHTNPPTNARASNLQSWRQHALWETTIGWDGYLSPAKVKELINFSIKKLIATICFFACLLLSVRPVYAYLDAGTASVLLQALLGGIAVVVASLSLFWQRLKSYFFKSKIDDQSDGDSNRAKDQEIE